MSSHRAHEMYLPGDRAFRGDHFQPPTCPVHDAQRGKMGAPRRPGGDQGHPSTPYYRHKTRLRSCWVRSALAVVLVPSPAPAKALARHRSASHGRRPPPGLSRAARQRPAARHVVFASSRGPCWTPGPCPWPVRHLAPPGLGTSWTPATSAREPGPSSRRLGQDRRDPAARSPRAVLGCCRIGRSGPPQPPRRSPAGTPGEPARTSDAARQPSRA